MAPARFLIAAILLASGPALAQDSLEEARHAYDAGAKAYDAREYAEALRLFDRADALAPNATALELAMASAVLIPDPVAAVTLLRRSKDRAGTPRLNELRNSIRVRFEKKVGFVGVRCVGHEKCAVSREGRRAESGHELVVPVGPNDITVETDGKPVLHHLELGAGQTVVLDVRGSEGAPLTVLPTPVVPPPKVEAPAPATGSGIAPTWFWAGTAVTGLLLGISIVSSFETRQRFQDYEAAPTPAGRDAGRGSQLRTNILFLATGGMALTTAATGVFFVRWRDAREPRASAWMLSYEGRF